MPLLLFRCAICSYSNEAFPVLVSSSSATLRTSARNDWEPYIKPLYVNNSTSSITSIWPTDLDPLFVIKRHSLYLSFTKMITIIALALARNVLAQAPTNPLKVQSANFLGYRQPSNDQSQRDLGYQGNIGEFATSKNCRSGHDRQPRIYLDQHLRRRCWLHQCRTVNRLQLRIYHWP